MRLRRGGRQDEVVARLVDLPVLFAGINAEHRRRGEAPVFGSTVILAVPPRRRPLLRRRFARILILSLAGLAAAGAATAHFTSSGRGTGTASMPGTVLQVALTPGVDPAPMVPGGRGDVKLTVKNGNPFPVHIGSLVLDPGQGNGGYDATGCSVAAADLAFTPDSTGWTIPAGAVAYPIDLANAISMGAGAANDCQGATFTVYLKAGAR
jgi:hypothetical protein